MTEDAKKKNISLENPNYEKCTNQKTISEMNFEDAVKKDEKSKSFKKIIFIKSLVFLFFCVFLVISVCTHSLIKVEDLGSNNINTTKTSKSLSKTNTTF